MGEDTSGTEEGGVAITEPAASSQGKSRGVGRPAREDQEQSGAVASLDGSGSVCPFSVAPMSV